MGKAKNKINFFETSEGHEFEEHLRQMQADEQYITEPSYTTNSLKYPNNLMPFVDKHIEYMVKHPKTNPLHYISNLRLTSRLK